MEENRIYWFALHLLLGVNLRQTNRLKDHFTPVKDIFQSSAQELLLLGLDQDKAEMITSGTLLSLAEKELKKVEHTHFSLITLEDEDYPPLLKEIYYSPVVLYCHGDRKALSTPCVAVVGTRRHTPYGRAVTEKLASDLAAQGITIVSGLARGIDSLAHQGALQARGKTIAVLGSGLNNVYPRENRSLYKKIMEAGAVISEFPLEAPPHHFHFPIRNRIISGLSLGVVVVEAAQRSGSLITARLALDQGREVMAVPGNITSSFSQGTHWLIKNGAKLVSSWEDVVEELPSPWREEIFSHTTNREKPAFHLSPEEEKVLMTLKMDEKIHIDFLSEYTDYSVPHLLSLLLDLELKELVIQHPGKYYQRKLL